MKKYLLISVVVIALLVLGVSVAFADSDNAAIVVNLDGDCTWFAGSFSAAGRIDYVQTQNGKWKLSCHADDYEGPVISEALVLTSSPDNPLGTCFSPAGATFKWHMVFTPAGQTHFICQGDATP